jgi:hypothetical protein
MLFLINSFSGFMLLVHLEYSRLWFITVSGTDVCLIDACIFRFRVFLYISILVVVLTVLNQ